MPTAHSKATARRNGRPVKNDEPEPQPLLDVVVPPDRPVEHNGIAVEREELIGNLPKAPFRISRLVLFNGETAYACRDCVFTGDSRGDVMHHRNEAHGMGLGGRKKVQDVPPLRSTPDPVLPPRSDGRPAPSEPMQWTLAELLAVAPSICALGDMVEETQLKLTAALEELNEIKNTTRENSAKAELYDEQRAELLELRNWKRKMTTRLNQMGFSLNEEEQ